MYSPGTYIDAARHGRRRVLALYLASLIRSHDHRERAARRRRLTYQPNYFTGILSAANRRSAIFLQRHHHTCHESRKIWHDELQITLCLSHSHCSILLRALLERRTRNLNVLAQQLALIRIWSPSRQTFFAFSLYYFDLALRHTLGCNNSQARDLRNLLNGAGKIGHSLVSYFVILISSR